MKNLVKTLRLKLLILMVLAFTTMYLGYNTNSSTACVECVTLSGGLCIGCDSSVTQGHINCTPDQSTCSCNVSGTCDDGGIGGEGGGQN